MEAPQEKSSSQQEDFFVHLMTDEPVLPRTLYRREVCQLT
jgi:hypothetical protein